MKEQQMTGVHDSWEDKHRKRWQMAGRWRNDLLAALLLACFAFWINRDLEIRGLYMDDLYLWSCYGEQSFWKYVFPIGSTRFRFLYYLMAWLELGLIGTHIDWIVPINILLNTGLAFTLYQMARKYSRSSYVGMLCGFAFLASRLSYYQIGQLYGLMETMALWMALGILYLLCEFLNDHGGRDYRGFYAACGLYFGVCFVHERYMVLLPLFFLALLCRKVRRWHLWAAPAGTFAAVQAIRFLAIGSVMPAGTGRTQVAETFSLGDAVWYALSQVAYLFGINAGPDHLNGQNFRQAPSWVMILIVAADLMLLAVLAAFLVKLVQEWRHCGSYLCTSLLFMGFLAGCIACSSVTIRVEMRWVYVSYAGALLYLSWMYGVLTEKMIKQGTWMRAVAFLAMLTLYVILMLPVELYYRGLYPRLYFMPDQQRYNSLAEETYGTYKDEIFGKTIYIVRNGYGAEGNAYDMEDFTRDTFLKVFDKGRKAENTRIVHLDDVREIGLVTDDMVILQEDPAHNCYQNITRAVRTMKCRGIYGYYEDGWIDENARIQVMAGSQGVIELDFYYPGEITRDQWIMIYVNEEPQAYLELRGAQTHTIIETEPYETLTLDFRTNFYVPDAREQRGEQRLAVVLAMKAD